jgi:hypothetical protein
MTILTISAIPPSPNILKRKYMNPHAYKRLREAWEQDLAHAVPGSRQRLELQRQAKAGKMFVEVTIYHSKLYDPDNAMGALKPVLDAMVRIGFLAGDSGAHLQLLPVRQELCPRKDVKTEIRLGPVD